MAKKSRFDDTLDDESEIDEERGSGDSGSELVMEDHVFKALYLLSSWVELSTTTRQLTVAISLHWGVGPGD